MIFGCGGHARSVADIQLQRDAKTSILFVDAQARLGERILNFPVCVQSPVEISQGFIAIGDNQARKQLWLQLQSKNLITIISPSAQNSMFSKIGRNVLIANLAHVGPEASIGDNSIINTGAIIEHEVRIGDHCHIGPNAVISGRSRLGDQVFIGVGAVVKDNISIASNIVVGAGAVVVQDLHEPGIYVGCPAKKR